MCSASHTPNVYVVDDDEGVCTALRRYLEACGFAVWTYGSGKAFLAETQPPRNGCLVLDLELPGLSGLEVLGHMQSRGWTLPVIVLSGSSDVSGEEHVLRSGARAFISNPPDSHLLLTTV